MSRVTAEQAREQLLILHQEWTRAVGSTKDYSFLDRHIDDGWQYTDYQGQVRNKPEYLKLVDAIVSYVQDMKRFDVRLVGEGVALITGLYEARAELKGGAKPQNVIAFSATWELRDGEWKSLLHHTTKVPSAP